MTTLAVDCRNCGRTTLHTEGPADRTAGGKAYLRWYFCNECGSKNPGPL